MEETDTLLVVEYHLRRQPQAEAIQDYVNDRSGSRWQGFLASQSTIPPHPNVIPGYRGQQARSCATSMIPSGNSEASRHSSLPALTIATSGTTSSVASSMGHRALEEQQRILEQDHGGVLVVPPLPGQRILECPFNSAFLCPLTFSNEKDWIDHSLEHFCTKERRVIDPPTLNSCCFCEAQFYSPNPLASWGQRMHHVCLHHCLGHRLGHARPDFALFKYLFDKHLISDADYRELKGNNHNRTQRAAAASYPTPPTSPDSPMAQMPPVPVYTETNRGRRGDRNRVR